MTETIYIAGPMTGYPEWNYPAFTEAAAALRALGHDVVSPHELHDDDMTRPFDWYLRRDLKALCDCTAIALLDGWVKSRGANLEYGVAQALDFTIYRYSDGKLEDVTEIARATR